MTETKREISSTESIFARRAFVSSFVIRTFVIDSSFEFRHSNFDLNPPAACDDCTGMFPMSALLTHAELTKRQSSTVDVGEARRAPRRMRHGNLTLFPRVEFAQPEAGQHVTEEQPRVIAAISNVSSTGVGLVLSEELPAGLEFDVDWHIGGFGGESPTPLTFEVVHSRPVSAGMYRIGARLILGILPEEGMDAQLASGEDPAGSEAVFIEQTVTDETATMEFAGGILRFDPQRSAISDEQDAPSPPGTFPADSAFGFDKTEKLDGVTSCGWERSITIRREGERLWIYIHSPGKKNGWGIYVQPEQFEAALARVQRAAQSPFISSMAA